jgi:hypothetical protein
MWKEREREREGEREGVEGRGGRQTVNNSDL